MRVHEARATDPGRLEAEVRAVLAAAPPDVVLQLRVSPALAGAVVLRAARLRAIAPPSATVTLAVGVDRGRGRRLDFATA